MDVIKLIEVAAKLGLPGIVSDVVSGLAKMKQASDKAQDTLSSADKAELDQIHDRALEVTDELIAKADAASRR